MSADAPTEAELIQALGFRRPLSQLQCRIVDFIAGGLAIGTPDPFEGLDDKIKDQGQAAYRAGIQFSDHPYEKGSDYARAWQVGWRDAEFDKAVPEVKGVNDAVDHPAHYTSSPSGVECIVVTEHMNFCLGNAMKYLWRADMKNGLEDLRKAKWYIEREIARRLAASHGGQF